MAELDSFPDLVDMFFRLDEFTFAQDIEVAWFVFTVTQYREARRVCRGGFETSEHVDR